jgi:hypothetical protein
MRIFSSAPRAIEKEEEPEELLSAIENEVYIFILPLGSL